MKVSGVFLSDDNEDFSWASKYLFLEINPQDLEKIYNVRNQWYGWAFPLNKKKVKIKNFGNLMAKCSNRILENTGFLNMDVQVNLKIQKYKFRKNGLEIKGVHLKLLEIKYIDE